jgi:hypothetical protein
VTISGRRCEIDDGAAGHLPLVGAFFPAPGKKAREPEQAIFQMIPARRLSTRLRVNARRRATMFEAVSLV